MRPVYQTLFGGSDSEPETMGNCYPACIATLLELPLEVVPHVYQMYPGQWVRAAEEMRAFLSGLGCTMLMFNWTEDEQGEWTRSAFEGWPVVITVQSPRGPWLHAVVGRIKGTGWELLHDPFPGQPSVHLERVVPDSFEVVLFNPNHGRPVHRNILPIDTTCDEEEPSCE